MCNISDEKTTKQGTENPSGQVDATKTVYYNKPAEQAIGIAGNQNSR